MQAEIRARLAGFAAGFATRRILVAGDLMLDEFIWGNVSRISPEAPVPIVDVTGESYYPGGAANVARNLREFTTHVSIMGLTGADAAGDQLLGLLAEAGIDTAAVERDPAFSTIRKTRVIARNQQVVRVDRERKSGVTGPALARAIEQIDRIAPSVDAIIVADYGKGFVTQALADHLCRSASAHGKILTVDPHPHTTLDWSGVTAVKPNRLEAFLAAGMPPSEPVTPVLEDQTLIEVGRRLRRRWQAENLLITLGEHGMLLLADDMLPVHLPTHAKEVFDVSGAGDTAIAVFTLGLAAAASPMEAAELANRASGIAVGKLGTATVTPAELQASLRS
ncbi:MAG TPA: bifunctional ADP-heptose synthase [Bryobacteraceae bacterium]|nr:bifunctional ADP-heptose synthase [Bryobacteraceae bacterium]